MIAILIMKINKLFTRKQDDCNPYNENYFFQIQLTQKIPTSNLTIKKRQMRLTLTDLIDSKEFMHEWINGWDRWGFIHIAVTLGKVLLLKVIQFSLSERFFKSMKFFPGLPLRDYWQYNFIRWQNFCILYLNL